MGTWMTRGQETRYVPDWNVDNMAWSGWSVAKGGPGHLTFAPSEDKIRAPQSDGPAPGQNYDGSVIPEQDFFSQYVQRAAEKFGNDPVTQRSGQDVSAKLPRAGAFEWLRENVSDYQRYSLVKWDQELVNGHVVYKATFRDSGGPGVAIRRNLAGASRGSEFTVTFQGAEAEVDPIDKLDNEAIDTYGLAESGIDPNRARQIRDRINTSFNIENFPREIQQAILNGELKWQPGQVAKEVKDVLENESLGDLARREFLAEMVLDEYETSAYAVEFKKQEEVPETEGGFDPFDYINSVLSGLLGGGGGGGPTYRPPDRREVEENVQNYLRTVLGDTGDPALVDELADIYMRDHRRSFDNPGLGLQPWFSVKEKVRAREEYQKLHALRPDTIPEEQWVTQFQQIVDEAGVPATFRDQTARNFAQTGTTLRSALPAAYRQNEMRTGRPQPTFLNNLAQSVSTLARKF